MREASKRPSVQARKLTSGLRHYVACTRTAERDIVKIERKITNRSDYGNNSKRVVKTKCNNGRDIISHPKRNEKKRRVCQIIKRKI